MKLQFSQNKGVLSAAIILAVASPVAFGAGIISLFTNGSGNFLPAGSLGTGSWSGNVGAPGTVAANLDGTGGGGGSPKTIVTNTSGGTLSGGNFMISAGDPATFWNGNKQNTGVGLTITISTTGTNPSFDIGGINPIVIGGSSISGWQNLAVSNMTNVESLTVTYSFSSALAAIRGTGNAPFLVGMRRAAGGSLYNATGTIANLTVDGNPYSSSVLSGGGGFVEFATTLPSTVETPSVVWNDTTGIGTLTNHNTDQFHGITRLDIDGGGVAIPTLASATDGTVDEIERTYATGMTWTITKNGGGALNTGSAFYFSFNGVQYVPEPSSSILVALGLSLGLGYRRRPQSR